MASKTTRGKIKTEKVKFSTTKTTGESVKKTSSTVPKSSKKEGKKTSKTAQKASTPATKAGKKASTPTQKAGKKTSTQAHKASTPAPKVGKQVSTPKVETKVSTPTPKTTKKQPGKGRAAKKKTKVSSSWKRFSKAFKSGKLPKNAVTRKLSQYFGPSGKPLKHKLRSEAAKEEFNRLLKQYNKQRMTQKKQEQKRKGIREKQLETHRRNLMPEQAAEGTAQYEKALDVLETVADDISNKITYQQVMEIISEAPELDPEEIVTFIKESYERLQNELPDFAKLDDDAQLDAAFNDILETIHEVGTTDMRDLRYAFVLKDMNPAEYEAWLEDRW